jgi:hypothetical protein
MSTGQTGPAMVSQPKMLKPKNPEVDEWKVVKAKVKVKRKALNRALIIFCLNM